MVTRAMDGPFLSNDRTRVYWRYAAMAPNATATDKPKRVVKRLTPAEKREKAIANIDVEVSKATDALLRATQGAFLARDMERARQLMGVADALMSAGLASEEQAKAYGLA